MARHRRDRRRPRAPGHQVATLLRGKHKPIFAPHVDTGDFVIVVNADKVALTGNKREAKDRLPPLGLPGRPARHAVRRAAGEAPGEGRREGRQGDASPQQPRPAHAQEAEGLRRPGAPAPGAISRSPSRSPRSRSRRSASPADRPREKPRDTVAETTTEPSRPTPSRRRRRAPQLHHRVVGGVVHVGDPARDRHRPGAATGRRKQAIARVRLIPGTGQWTVNGRALDEYFPNKVHQQLVNDPFVTLERRGPLRRHRAHPRWRRLGPGRRAAPGHRAGAQRDRRGGQPSDAKAGRLPHPRPAGQGAQEVRPEEGPQGAPVQQALIVGGLVGRVFGTDGVRGLAEPRPHRRARARPVGRGRARARRRRCLRGAPAGRGRRARPPRVGRVPRRCGRRRAGQRRRRRPRRRRAADPGRRLPHRPTWAPTSAPCISASHNPMPDNGHQVPRPRRAQARRRARGRDREAAARGRGSARLALPSAGCARTRRSAQRYVDHLLSTVPAPAGRAARGASTRANGAASAVAPAILQAAGADVVAIGDRPDGLNINDGYGSTHLDRLQAAVLEHGADAGIALDGDADRCLAVDATGAFVDGDQILAVLALAMREKDRLRDSTRGRDGDVQPRLPAGDAARAGVRRRDRRSATGTCSRR